MKVNKNKLLRLIVVLTYLIMIGINGLANILPINGVTTGEVSDLYPNLFAPSGITFSIWGVIYILLGLYTIYQLEIVKPSRTKNKKREYLDNKIRRYFILSSILNSIWIISWHYRLIGISTLLILFILLILFKINKLIQSLRLKSKDRFFIKLPFSVYLGWITIATIANITVFLVSINWDMLGLSEVLWTAVILILGIFMTMFYSIKNNDIVYGLVILWSYIGIYIKHTSTNGFAFEYPTIVKVLVGSILVNILTVVYLLNKSIKNK